MPNRWGRGKSSSSPTSLREKGAGKTTVGGRVHLAVAAQLRGIEGVRRITINYLIYSFVSDSVIGENDMQRKHSRKAFAHSYFGEKVKSG